MVALASECDAAGGVVMFVVLKLYGAIVIRSRHSKLSLILQSSELNKSTCP